MVVLNISWSGNVDAVTSDRWTVSRRTHLPPERWESDDPWGMAVSNETSEVVYSTSTVGFSDPEPPRLVAATPPDIGPSSGLSDATLGARARDGDVDAFEELLRTHQGELFRLAFRMLGDRDQAQDVVVKTLSEGWRKLPASPKSVSFRIWMTRTAMQRCLQKLSGPAGGTSSVTAADKPELTLVGAPAEDQPAAPTDRPALDVALDALSPAERACWVLKELHGMSDTDISHAMGVTPSSVTGRVTRARRRLVSSMAAA